MRRPAGAAAVRLIIGIVVWALVATAVYGFAVPALVSAPDTMLVVAGVLFAVGFAMISYRYFWFLYLATKLKGISL